MAVARQALHLAAGCAVWAGSSAAEAQIVGQFSADAVLSEGYSRNPLLTGGQADTIFAELSISPQYVLREPRATTFLSGTYRRSRYFTSDDSTQSFGAFVQHSRQIDAATSLTIGITAASSIAGERQPLFVSPIDLPRPEDPGVPVTPSDLTVPPGAEVSQPQDPLIDPNLDPTLIGTGRRTTTLNITGGMSTRLGAFDSVSVNLAMARTFQGSAFAIDSRTYSGDASYSRTLSARSTAGARISLSRTDYLDPTEADASIIQAQLTYSMQVSPAINVNAALGGLFIKSADGKSDSNGFSGSFSACRRGELDSLCISLARDASAAGIGGVRKQLSGGLSYSYRLGPTDNLGAGVSYYRYGASSDGTLPAENLSTDLFWSTRLSQRLSGGVSLSLRDQLSTVRPLPADFSGQVYVSARLGRLR